MSVARRPALALGLLVLAIALAAMAVAVPVTRALEQRQALERGDERLTVIRSAVRDGKGLAEIVSAGLLVPGDTVGQAAAEVQRKIRLAAQGFNAAIRTIHPQVLRAKRDGDLTEISLEISLQASTAALRDLIHLMETSTPLMIVDVLSIRAGAGSADSRSRPVELDVFIKLRSFAAAREAQ